MAGAPTNALAAMSLKEGKDWGDPDKPVAEPAQYHAKLTGFQPDKSDIFYFFSEHPNLDKILDPEIVDITIDENEQFEGLPVAWLIVNNKDAALRALHFSHELFDGREVIVSIDGLSLDDAATPHEQQPPFEEQAAPVQQQPEPVHEPEPEPEPPVQQPAPVEPPRQEDSYGGRGGGGGGGYGGRDQGYGGRDQGGGYGDRRSGQMGSGGGYGGDRDRDDRSYGYGRRDDYDNRGGGGGGYDNRRGGGGYGSGYGRRDDDRQGGGSNYGMGGGGGGGGRTFDRAPRGGDETLEMDADALAKASSGRKRLNLKKRTPAAGASSRPAARPAPARSSIFGDAKPREEVLRKKGVDPNARPVRQQQPQSSIRGGGNRGPAPDGNNRGYGGNRGQPQQPGKTEPPVVKDKNVFDVLDAE